MSPVGNRAMSYPQGSPLPPNAGSYHQYTFADFLLAVDTFLLGTVLH